MYDSLYVGAKTPPFLSHTLIIWHTGFTLTFQALTACVVCG